MNTTKKDKLINLFRNENFIKLLNKNDLLHNLEALRINIERENKKEYGKLN